MVAKRDLPTHAPKIKKASLLFFGKFSAFGKRKKEGHLYFLIAAQKTPPGGGSPADGRGGGGERFVRTHKSLAFSDACLSTFPLPFPPFPSLRNSRETDGRKGEEEPYKRAFSSPLSLCTHSCLLPPFGPERSRRKKLSFSRSFFRARVCERECVPANGRRRGHRRFFRDPKYRGDNRKCFLFHFVQGQTESVRAVSFFVLLPSSAGADRRNKKGA